MRGIQTKKEMPLQQLQFISIRNRLTAMNILYEEVAKHPVEN